MKRINSPIIPSRIKKPPEFRFFSLAINDFPRGKKNTFSDNKITPSLAFHHIFRLGAKAFPHENMCQNSS
jgi:hypothetical protein